jgi:hypothetical protein
VGAKSGICGTISVNAFHLISGPSALFDSYVKIIESNNVIDGKYHCVLESSFFTIWLYCNVRCFRPFDICVGFSRMESYRKSVLASSVFLIGYFNRPEILLFVFIIIVEEIVAKRWKVLTTIMCMVCLLFVIDTVVNWALTGHPSIITKSSNLRIWNDSDYLKNEEIRYSQPGFKDIVWSSLVNYPSRFYAYLLLVLEYAGYGVPILLLFWLRKFDMFLFGLVFIFVMAFFGIIIVPRLVMIPVFCLICLAMYLAIQKKRIVMACIVVLIGYVPNIPYLQNPDEKRMELKKAGEIVAPRVRNTDRFLDRKPYIAFYAGGRYREIPWGSSDQILSYLDTSRVSFFVLSYQGVIAYRPQLLSLYQYDTFRLHNVIYSRIYWDSLGAVKIYQRE